MSDNKLGVAIVHEICPICGKPMNESIVINKRLTVKEAKKVEDMNHKAIGFSQNACDECLKYKDTAVFCIAIDCKKSTPKEPYRTGQLVGIRKDFELFINKPEFVHKTKNGVSFCFIDEDAGKEIGMFK